MSTYQVLTLGEKVALSKIPTTKKQARQILRRNTQLLERVNEVLAAKGDRSAYDEDVMIGCPHCQAAGFNCEDCPWGKLGMFNMFGCLSRSFGRVTGNDVTDDDLNISVHLNRDSASIRWDRTTSPYFKLAGLRGAGRKCRLFLQGHIEWAEAVISGEIKEWKHLMKRTR